MQKLADILRFKKELFFEGAVQLDWFYDMQKREDAARSFIFHGPEYFGVSHDDIQTGFHKLIDTCTFSRMIAKCLYDDSEENPLIMAIAGYGSGKSHLALTLATLFSSTPDNPLCKQILKNISDADRRIGTELAEMIDRPNLVIALNGMKDFNLTYEILSSARKALKQYNVDESPLREITRAYEVARTFLHRNFDRYMNEFETAAAKQGVELTGNQLVQYLDENLESQTTVFEIINEVYQEATGVPIRWDDGISAGDILSKLQDAFCGDRGVFNKILILFDEFGRFIEYASEFPTRAGQSAIQQIFEAIQNSNRNIIFVGFIQSDLKSYLARVEKSSNIVRYVGRFEASDKVYLSSNLETIFANLIERKDPKLFYSYITNNRSWKSVDWKTFHKDLLRWLPAASERSLWRQWEKFSKVVLEGTYPLHPLTTWMLANLSNWLQQRSALTFLNSEFEALAKSELFEFADLPTIYPIRLIQSDFFIELLRAEEEGRQQSEYCILYNQVLRKHKDKCSQVMIDVLAANLILRIGRFKTEDRDQVVRALSYCLPHDIKVIEDALYELENELGVLSFDDAAGCFDFVEDATGAKDFRRFITRLRAKTQIDPSLVFQSNELKKLLGVDKTINTAFANKKSIRTQEWQYNQEIIPLSDISPNLLKIIKNEWLNSTSPDKPKGKIIWVYMGQNDNINSLQSLQELIRSNGLDNSPILFFLLNDGEGQLIDAIRDLTILKRISPEDRGRFARFIPDFEMKAIRSVEDKFKELAVKRTLITGSQIENIKIRLAEYCEKRFEQVYPKVISFPFEGFQNKNITPAKKLLAQIAKNLLTGKMDYQSVQAMSRDFKNRVEAVLVVDRHMSWGVLTNEIQLTYPQDEGVRFIYSEIDNVLEESGYVDITSIFTKYLAPPYGLNEFSLGLLLACYISYKGPGVKVRLEGKLIKTLDWAERTYLDKGIDFKVLENTELVRVDVDKYLARYTYLCDLIERTTDISEAYKLSEDLEALKQEQEVPKELNYRVKACGVILDECVRVYKAVTRELEEQHEELEHAIRFNDMKKLLSIINVCEGKYGHIGNSRFTYSPTQTEEFNRLAEKARTIIENTFDSWLASLKCDSVAQVSAFENFVKKIIKSLNDAGYWDFARKTQSRLETILDDMNHIRMLQTIRERIETYLRDCRPSNIASYDQLSEWKRTGLELENFIVNHPNLSEVEILDYKAKIRRKLDAVEKAFNELYEQISEAYDIAFKLTTIGDCRTLLSKIRNIFSRNIKSEDRESLEDIARDVEMFLADVEPLSNTSMGRFTTQEAIRKIRDKWNNKESDVDFNLVLDNIWADKEARFDEYDQAWVKQYLNYKQQDIATWDVNQCLRWQKDTELLPNYLREETIQRYYHIKNMVKNRLSDLKIEAVVKLFNQLTPEQRKICLEKLLKIANKIDEPAN